LSTLAMLFINGHNYGFQIGLFFFSFHLLVLGFLVFQSGYIPKILGILLFVAFFSYFIDSSGKILLVNYPYIISRILFLPMLVGELSLIVWLVLKGGKLPEMKSRN